MSETKNGAGNAKPAETNGHAKPQATNGVDKPKATNGELKTNGAAEPKESS